MSSALSSTSNELAYKDAVPPLLTLPASRNARRLMLAAIFALLVGFGLAVPLSGVQLTRVDAFLPAYEIALFICDLITSALLFSQFSVLGSRALLVLACGYLFTALMVIPHLLTFPGVVQPSGLIGGANSPPWVYAFWHAGFPLAVIGYALLKSSDLKARHRQGSAGGAILSAVAFVIVLVFGLTMIATRGERLLPTILLASGTWADTWWYIAAVLWLLSLTALIVVWTRIRSVLDVLLCVVLCAWLIEISLNSFLSFTRYTVGWYSGRLYGFLAATFVLIALIVETTALFARLARANMLLEHERDNKLMNLEAMAASIAHEVRQPLSAIAANGSAALRFLGCTPADLKEVRSSLNSMINDSHSASQIFDNLRALFGKSNKGQELIDVNEMALGALQTLRGELDAHEVSTRTELTSEVLHVMGHRGQLNEVIINLVQNAIDAMDAVKKNLRVLRLSTKCRADAIIVAVEDSGPGIDPKKSNSIFDAFVTTKSNGMGLGLAICRMIVERHEGQLSVGPAHPHGCIFQIVLPRTNLPL